MFLPPGQLLDLETSGRLSAPRPAIAISPDGTRLVYGTFSAGKPTLLFEGPHVPTPRSFPDYDVSPDGQRFLMLKPNEQAQATADQCRAELV